MSDCAGNTASTTELFETVADSVRHARYFGTGPGAQSALTALDSLRSRMERMEEFIAWLEPMQQGTVAMIRREGFVFETPLQESEGWEKLAFTLYSQICEIDSHVAHLIQETVDA
jgi:hypothetical protein